MLRIAVCDDDESEIKLIRGYSERYTVQYDNVLKVKSFSSGEELLKTYKKGDFDLILMDVEMGKMDGIYVADQIRHIPDHDVNIMYVSNFPQYMQASFGVRAAQYLTKPLNYETFSNKINELINYIAEDKEKIVDIYYEGEHYYVGEASIIMIESRGAKLQITTENDCFNIRGKISDYQSICEKYMIMPNRSILVNTRYIYKISGNAIELKNGHKIIISRRKIAMIKEAVGRNLAKRVN